MPINKYHILIQIFKFNSKVNFPTYIIYILYISVTGNRKNNYIYFRFGGVYIGKYT